MLEHDTPPTVMEMTEALEPKLLPFMVSVSPLMATEVTFGVWNDIIGEVVELPLVIPPTVTITGSPLQPAGTPQTSKFSLIITTLAHSYGPTDTEQG